MDKGSRYKNSVLYGEIRQVERNLTRESLYKKPPKVSSAYRVTVLVQIQFSPPKKLVDLLTKRLKYDILNNVKRKTLDYIFPRILMVRKQSLKL